MKASSLGKLALGLAAAASGTAQAQVQPTGPFTGSVSEGFETQPLQMFVECIEGRAFDDSADLCAQLAEGLSILDELEDGADPRSGEQMFHSFVFMEIRFDHPVRRFGGYFASRWLDQGDIQFFDPNGQLLGDLDFAMSPCTVSCVWTWNGWETSAPQGISRIQLSSPTALGGYFQLDDMEINYSCEGEAQTYCTAKPNSLGCLPAIASSGFPRVSESSGFTIEASEVRNNRVGLLLYSLQGRAALAFQGGTLCVQPPVLRTVPVASGGSAPPIEDCSGVYALDMNAFAAGQLGGSPAPELAQPSTLVATQWWGRDGGDPFGTTLSDGLEYITCP